MVLQLWEHIQESGEVNNPLFQLTLTKGTMGLGNAVIGEWCNIERIVI
jgi:hypothetical protein